MFSEESLLSPVGDHALYARNPTKLEAYVILRD
jgi:hypothetical protein